MYDKDGYYKKFDLKEFISDHKEFFIVSGVVIFLISLICYMAIPIEETMFVNKLRWSWDIPVYEYRVHNEDKWYSAPSDAYDVERKREIHHWDTVTDSEWTDSKGNTHKITHSEPVYAWHYYYKINKWDNIQTLNAVGFDRNPHEPECNLESIVVNPKIGDKKRGSHKETYDVFGTDKKGKEHRYYISESDWENIEIGGKIKYKRHRFGDKIFEIKFC